MSKKYKSLLPRECIAAVAAEVADQLARLLSLAGVTIRAKVQQSKRTGSVYLKIKVLDTNGEKLKDCAVAIRIARHVVTVRNMDQNIDFPVEKVDHRSVVS